MKILMLLSNPFRPDPRVYNEAFSLLKAGYDVEVLAWDRSAQYPKNATVDGIVITRLTNTRFMQLLQRDILRLRFFWKLAYETALTKKVDIVHCHDLDTLPAGVNLKKKVGIPLIYDAHEVFSYMVERDLPKFAVNYFLKLEKKLIGFPDHIITVTEKHRDYFNTLGRKDVSIIMNCKETLNEKYVPLNNDKFTILYIGGLSSARFLLPLVDVMSGEKSMKLKIGGIGPLYGKIKDLASKAPMGNIEFLGEVPFKKVIPLTMEADAIFCMVDPSNRNNRIGPQNKLYEAMVAGRPLIVTKGTYGGDLVEKLNCGLAVDYTSEALREVLVKLQENPKLREELGNNGLKAALSEYNWKAQQEKLLKVYDGLKGEKKI